MRARLPHRQRSFSPAWSQTTVNFKVSPFKPWYWPRSLWIADEMKISAWNCEQKKKQRRPYSGHQYGCSWVYWGPDCQACEKTRNIQLNSWWSQEPIRTEVNFLRWPWELITNTSEVNKAREFRWIAISLSFTSAWWRRWRGFSRPITERIKARQWNIVRFIATDILYVYLTQMHPHFARWSIHGFPVVHLWSIWLVILGYEIQIPRNHFEIFGLSYNNIILRAELCIKSVFLRFLMRL